MKEFVEVRVRVVRHLQSGLGVDTPVDATITLSPEEFLDRGAGVLSALRDAVSLTLQQPKERKSLDLAGLSTLDLGGLSEEAYRSQVEGGPIGVSGRPDR